LSTAELQASVLVLDEAVAVSTWSCWASCLTVCAIAGVNC